PLLAGRDFSDRDDASSPKVAIVNEAFARRFYGSTNVVGKRFGDDGPQTARDLEIAGVVKDTKYESLREESRPIYYVPMRQAAKGVNGMVVAVRSSVDLAALAPTVRDAVHRVDPQVTKITRFSTLIDASLASERMVA